MRDDHFCQIYSTSLASAAAANFFLQSRTNVACLCILPSNIKSWNPILRCDTEKKDWGYSVIISASPLPIPFSVLPSSNTHTHSLSASFLFSEHTLSSPSSFFQQKEKQKKKQYNIYSMAVQKRVFLFGDQTVETYHSIKELARHSRRSSSLSSFFRKSYDAVYDVISKLHTSERGRFFSFGSILGLAEAYVDSGVNDVAISTVLLCFVQLGFLIMYVARNHLTHIYSKSQGAIC